MKRILAVLCLISSVFLFGVSAAYAVPAEDFTLTALDGNAVTLSDFKGKENVLLVFGATWCPYCIEEIPTLKDLHAQYGTQGLAILALDIREPLDKVRAFADKKGITYTVLLDSDGTVAAHYGVRGIPTNIFIDKNGEILYRGSLDREKVESLLKENT